MDKESAAKISESGLRNQLKAVRTRLGLSQAELALAAGITRQTIGGIEGSLYAPSAAVALRLARALGCRVDELFWLEDSPVMELEVKVVGDLPGRLGERVLVGKVGKEWVAHSLVGEQAFRLEMIPADGEITKRGPDTAKVRTLDTPEALARTVLVAGCAPAISLWTRSAERWHPGLRPVWIFANSSAALELLGRGEVHIAGIHLLDPQSGVENETYVRELSARTGRRYVLVNFGVWQEGLVVTAGNPLGLTGVKDLSGGGARLVNREAGAGGRVLLDQQFSAAQVDTSLVAGYDYEVSSHHAVVEAVLRGEADCGVVPRALAEIHGLGFVGLRKVRFDLVLLEETLQEEPVKQLLGTLEHRTVRQQLTLLGGLETEESGTVLARIG